LQPQNEYENVNEEDESAKFLESLKNMSQEEIDKLNE
jgi:hypothetical protein